MEIIAEGNGEYFAPDPDGFRAWVRDHKSRTLVNKVMNEHEAIKTFVSDGDYLAYDCNYFQRGPSSLIREVIRQKKRSLWVCGKFTYVALALLVEAGCATKADIAFVGFGPWLSKAVADGRLETFEYSNVVVTYRLQAGAQGLPFIAVRSFGGTDGFLHSGAKLAKDPFSGKPIVLLPALNPDVSIVHVHQADIYGNARVFGTGISHVDCALASKKVIISAEEIIETDEFRRDPGRTSIPHFVVDAVVHAPYGAYPGTVQGKYASDVAHVVECFGGTMRGNLGPYLDKWVYSVGSHEEMLEKRVGFKKLQDLQRRETIREGYSI